MNRRGFVGATLAGLGGFFFSQKTKASDDQWWEERDFVFEGVPGTEYSCWPRDRLIHLAPDADKDGLVHAILVATFSQLTIEGGLDQNIRESIKVHKDTDGDKYCGSHIHVIYVEGLPNHVGLAISSEKCHPVIDCWADSDIREQRLLKRQKESSSVYPKVQHFCYSPGARI